MFFHANWCGKCKMWEPIVKKVCEDTKTDFVDCDASTSMELFDKYGVQNLPVAILRKDDGTEKRIDHIIPEEELKKEIKKFK
jgi:thioredoxin 1